MQFLIFSDSHGNYRPMAEVIRRHPEVRTVLFLGDGLADLEQLYPLFPQHTFRAVRGNMDFLAREAEDLSLFSLFSCRVLMMHGHTHGVKGGVGGALCEAKRQGARVLLYGHTHQPENRYLPEEEIYLFNPGSIGRPHDGIPRYGLLDILPNGSLMLSHGELKR